MPRDFLPDRPTAVPMFLRIGPTLHSHRAQASAAADRLTSANKRDGVARPAADDGEGSGRG